MKQQHVIIIDWADGTREAHAVPDDAYPSTWERRALDRNDVVQVQMATVYRRAPGKATQSAPHSGAEANPATTEPETPDPTQRPAQRRTGGME